DMTSRSTSHPRRHRPPGRPTSFRLARVAGSLARSSQASRHFVRATCRGPDDDPSDDRELAEPVFDGRFRTALDKGVRPIGSGIRRTGVTADQLTAIGLVFAVACALTIASGRLFLGFVLLVLSALPDVFDGAVAKASGTASDRGAF